MQPVWVLSVDLQTKTATFQSGLSEAARSARGAFTDIKAGAGDMGRATSGHMMEARHGVVLLGEEFGVHLPRALTSFIASIGPVGAAMEAAFPFLAIGMMATLLIEHLVKLHAAGEALTEDQVKFGTAVQNAFNQLDTKIVQAQVKADELSKNHLGALRHELELIDKESMEELVKSFEQVEKAADVVFKGLKTSWYQFGAGSEGARNALEKFQTQYDSLLSQGKSDDASGLLTGTLKQAQKVLDFQKEYAANQAVNGGGGDYAKFEEASNGLKAMGVSISSTTAGIKNETESQQALVDALNAQVGIEGRIAALKSLEKGNAKTSESQKGAKDAAAAAKRQAEALKEGRELYVRELIETNKQAVELVQRGEKENVEATKSGTVARLAAIQTAMTAEQQMGLQGSAFFGELLNERIALEQKLNDESVARDAEAKREESDNTEKMGQLDLAKFRAHQALLDSAHKLTADQRLADAIKEADWAYALEQAGFGREAAALDTASKDYDNKLKAIQNKEQQNAQAHENKIAAIKEAAEEASNQRLLKGTEKFLASQTNGLTQAIMGHESFAKMVTSLGDQVVSSMISNSLKVMLQQDAERFSNARTAATSAFKTGEAMGPAGIVLGPVFGAAAFAAAMAFSGGGITPGIGTGDTVPAMLTPGEPVLPLNMAARLNRAMDDRPSGTHYNVRVSPTYHVNVLDGDGLQTVLDKHTGILQKHFENSIRKMNR
jgi:hypothetical protein